MPERRMFVCVESIIYDDDDDFDEEEEVINNPAHDPEYAFKIGRIYREEILQGVNQVSHKFLLISEDGCTTWIGDDPKYSVKKFKELGNVEIPVVQD